VKTCKWAVILRHDRAGAEQRGDPHVKSARLAVGKSAEKAQQRKPVMNAAPVYDLLLQGGHVICPASGIDGVMDVAIAGGTIAFVGNDTLPSTSRQVIDVRGKLVLPGMIDTHAHIYRYVRARDEITESKEKNPAAGRNAGKESGVYA
jgi:imidazolonepropionase-like amidohydrolase